jgi:indole-3-glycerol phosphate synthase
MDVLVEIHDQRELALALTLTNRLIGINNRNLHTFATSLDTTYELLDQIDDSRIVITESGFNRTEQVRAMRARGVNGFLIGEAFMRAENPGKALELMFADNEINSAKPLHG